MKCKRTCMLICCVLVCGSAEAQYHPDKELVFSGIVSESMCSKLPGTSFSILPSGGRWATKDRLTVQCNPLLLSLTLTFTIDGSVPSAFDQNIYTFRWQPKAQRHTGFKGQFTHQEKLCSELRDLFYLVTSTTPTSSSDPALTAMHWSATCNEDDQWGTSMEIEASPHAEVRNPRRPFK